MHADLQHLRVLFHQFLFHSPFVQSIAKEKLKEELIAGERRQSKTLRKASFAQQRRKTQNALIPNDGNRTHIFYMEKHKQLFYVLQDFL